MFYKNISYFVKTFHGVTFNPNEIKEVNDYINDPHMILADRPTLPHTDISNKQAAVMQQKPSSDKPKKDVPKVEEIKLELIAEEKVQEAIKDEPVKADKPVSTSNKEHKS